MSEKSVTHVLHWGNVKPQCVTSSPTSVPKPVHLAWVIVLLVRSVLSSPSQEAKSSPAHPHHKFAKRPPIVLTKQQSVRFGRAVSRSTICVCPLTVTQRKPALCVRSMRIANPVCVIPHSKCVLIHVKKTLIVQAVLALFVEVSNLAVVHSPELVSLVALNVHMTRSARPLNLSVRSTSIYKVQLSRSVSSAPAVRRKLVTRVRTRRSLVTVRTASVRRVHRRVSRHVAKTLIVRRVSCVVRPSSKATRLSEAVSLTSARAARRRRTVLRPMSVVVHEQHKASFTHVRLEVELPQARRVTQNRASSTAHVRRRCAIPTTIVV